MTRKYIQNCTGDGCMLEKKNLERSRLISRLIFYALSICFFGVAAYFLLFAPYLQVSKVDISGTAELKSEDLSELIQQSLTGKYLNFIPKNNFLFVSQNKIENLLKEKYKKIRSVSVEKQFPDTLKVTIDERKGLLVWCQNADHCFMLDENGMAYNEADFNSPELQQNHLLQITDQSNENITIGEKVMDANFEQYLTSLKENIQKLGVILNDQFVTPSRMAGEIDAQTADGAQLFFSTEFSQDSAQHTLAVMFKKELPLEKLNTVSYIDLRSENTIFYKLNDGQTLDSQQVVGNAVESASKIDNKKSSDKKK